MLQRWNQHIYNSRKKSGKGCHHFWAAIRQYGKDAFTHEILEIYHSVEDANMAEEAWIQAFSTRDPKFGFNLAKGGTHTPHPVTNMWDRPGFREEFYARNPNPIAVCLTPQARIAQLASLRSPESKTKRSAATKAAMARPDVKDKRQVFQRDPIYRSKISTSLKASLASPEVRGIMAERSMKLHEDPSYKARVSTAIKEAYSDPEVKERHREAVKNTQNRPDLIERRRSYRASDETKAKISAASTGKTHTAESKEFQRQLFLERRNRLLIESGSSTWSEHIKKMIAAKKSSVSASLL